MHFFTSNTGNVRFFLMNDHIAVFYCSFLRLFRAFVTFFSLQPTFSLALNTWVIHSMLKIWEDKVPGAKAFRAPWSIQSYSASTVRNYIIKPLKNVIKGTNKSKVLRLQRGVKQTPKSSRTEGRNGVDLPYMVHNIAHCTSLQGMK